ncbi:MAG: hypothetical protein H7A23_07890 [Leptospiraceae bacterium]|nr:hypothetical protein [Leptospiraceae bacterium]MCP5494464.1 hypothetical protein [Leptospiraceae bacterium]
MKPFAKWTIEEVEETFHIELQKNHKLLKDWIEASGILPSQEETELAKLQEKLLDHVWDWNEEELKVYFIIPLVSLVDFEHPYYKPFLDRELSMDYKEEKITGKVDFLIAGGKRSPKRPFFFIHEYKKEHDSSNDPLGQLMIAMIAAQQLNNDKQCIYGVYIMGRYWHFVILDENEYEVHTGLNAADQEIKTIFYTLKNTKKRIEERIRLQIES